MPSLGSSLSAWIETRVLKSPHETKDLFESTGDEPELSSLPDQMDWKLNPIILTMSLLLLILFILHLPSSNYRSKYCHFPDIDHWHKSKTLSVVDDDDAIKDIGKRMHQKNVSDETAVVIDGYLCWAKEVQNTWREHEWTQKELHWQETKKLI